MNGDKVLGVFVELEVDRIDLDIGYEHQTP